MHTRSGNHLNQTGFALAVSKGQPTWVDLQVFGCSVNRHRQIIIIIMLPVKRPHGNVTVIGYEQMFFVVFGCQDHQRLCIQRVLSL